MPFQNNYGPLEVRPYGPYGAARTGSLLEANRQRDVMAPTVDETQNRQFKPPPNK